MRGDEGNTVMFQLSSINIVNFQYTLYEKLQLFFKTVFP